MRKLRLTLVSFVIGLVVSVPAVAVLAQCAPTIIVEGKVCTLNGTNCTGEGVCVCAYTCGPATEQGGQ